MTRTDDDQELDARRKAAWMSAARRDALLARDWSGAGAGPLDSSERRTPTSTHGGARAGAGANLALVAPGWVLYSRIGPLDPVGVVVDVLHTPFPDPETGEIHDRTAYRCYAYWRPGAPWQNLDAGDVDINQLTGIDRDAASEAVRALIKPLVLSRARKRRHQPLTQSEVAIIRDVSVLARAVAP